eukprot:3120285-Rhodomonas_salina.1
MTSTDIPYHGTSVPPDPSPDAASDAAATPDAAVRVSAVLCRGLQPQGEIEWIIEGSVTQLLKEAHREKIRTAFDLEFKNHLQTCLDNLEANKMLADALHGK